MSLRGRGIKSGIKKAMVGFIKTLFPPGSIYNAPAKAITSKEWLAKYDSKKTGRIIPVYQPANRRETPPVIENHPVSQRFIKYYNREIPEAYVLELPGGLVYGVDTNFIIAPSYHLLADVSREFGRYGGKSMQDCSLIQQKLKLPEPHTLSGNVAVITTCGVNNFHHWHYDAIPRIHLLKKAGLYEQMDHFIIAHSDLPFQKESLNLLGIPADRISNPRKIGSKLFSADKLYVPSLPSRLGTVSPWVIDVLRNLYNPKSEKNPAYRRIYLSRKNVSTRKIINNEAFNSLLKEFDIIEIFPEDFSVAQLAKILEATEFVISIHGSGLSNLCFIGENITVVDILAPYHQDGYYWMMSNIRNSKYIGFFAEGPHPPDDLDLVKNKIDDDLQLDIGKLRQLLTEEINRA
jgi:capsular polysaccharide biosynthesis protein